MMGKSYTLKEKIMMYLDVWVLWILNAISDLLFVFGVFSFIIFTLSVESGYDAVQKTSSCFARACL
jgi:cytochrome c oxidase subunit IV